MTNTTPQADEAARLAEEAKAMTMNYCQAVLNCSERATDQNVKAVVKAENAMYATIDRLRDLASRADSPVGEASNAPALPKPYDTGPIPKFSADQMHERWAEGWKAGYKHGAWAASPAVEAKPTAAEVTGEARLREALEVARRVMVEVIDEEWVPVNSSIAGALGVALDEISTALASPSEAQMAVAWQYSAAWGDGSRTWVECTEKDAQRLSQTEGYVVRPLYPPSAGAGATDFDTWWAASGFTKYRETALAAWEARGSAGAGAEPQEVAMLPDYRVHELARDNGDESDTGFCFNRGDWMSVTTFAEDIQRAFAASAGIRIRGDK